MCSTEFAAKRARILVGCYRKTDASDPEIYAAAVVSVLCRFHPDVVAAVTEPATGLPATCKFLPSIAEIAEACRTRAEDRAAARATAAQASLPPVNLEATRRLPVVDDTPGRLANMYVPAHGPHYAAMCERARTEAPKWWTWYRGHPKFGDGIKVPRHWIVGEMAFGKAARAILERNAPAQHADPAEPLADEPLSEEVAF